MPIRLSRLVLAAALVVGGTASTLAQPGGSLIEVAIDHARVLQIDRTAGTVIVGNPAIVDIEVLSADRLVLTGKSYGITNIVILDREGEVLIDEQVAVQTFEDNTLRVYRQAQRQTFACAPKCEPTVTIGDNPEYFSAASGQYEVRLGMAEAAAK
ncbi:Pilus formation protein N terminal region [Fulvimarina manganoxydans]|uniref:Pilus formation protein N terminal region n=1 Tax=Fulvimarina manganoxydans TaxID=937218 RepID=A0A1W1Z9X2_9HYPH|nr:pilus assembly protein N-terminal domain-containing protein [Fulvimarina manganoxydans]MCK5931407.1 pilus assembly protein N-terminal domain-containing protein [Fulvimarina manganoxydans]MEE2950421.1 pilus assembly protein N-terminal domain-containing protein [Pseudomonadota bacterium]SMC45142.1 Pilus formation protein N terminal region [Fulvimarina manganoxydans]